MTTPPKKTFRKRHLFPRTVDAVVKEATKPLMTKQGKLYGALLRDWAQIVGPARAAVTRPDRLQFPTREGDSGATLHLSAKPSAAPELAYETEQMLEQCARYFGYRAITRIMIHATHDIFTDSAAASTSSEAKKPRKSGPLPPHVPSDMADIFRRLAAHIASGNDSKNNTSH